MFGAGAWNWRFTKGDFSSKIRPITRAWHGTVGGRCFYKLSSNYATQSHARHQTRDGATASQGVTVKRLRFLIFVATAVGMGLAGALYFMAQLRITLPSAFDPKWASIAIYIIMVGGSGSIEGALIGAAIYFFADRYFGEFGAAYLVVLGVLTLLVALYARTGVWRLICKRFDAP